VLFLCTHDLAPPVAGGSRAHVSAAHGQHGTEGVVEHEAACGADLPHPEPPVVRRLADGASSQGLDTTIGRRMVDASRTVNPVRPDWSLVSSGANGDTG
jgi:hypothetical protein